MSEKQRIIDHLMAWQQAVGQGSTPQEEHYFSVDSLHEHLSPEAIEKLRGHILDRGGNPDRLYLADYRIAMEGAEQGVPLETTITFHYSQWQEEA